MSISKELAKEAKKKGICKEWHTELKHTEDVAGLAAMYLSGIDFCLSNDYPSNDYLRKHFKGKMEPYGIHLDDNIQVKNERKVVALGTCTGIIEIGEYNVSELFVKHNSDLVLVVRDNAFVMVDMFDDSKLNIIAGDNARVCVNRYGGDVEYESYGDSYVKFKEKNKKTY